MENTVIESLSKCCYRCSLQCSFFHIHHSGSGTFIMIAKHCRIMSKLLHLLLQKQTSSHSHPELLRLPGRGLKIPFLALSSSTPVELIHMIHYPGRKISKKNPKTKHTPYVSPQSSRFSPMFSRHLQENICFQLPAGSDTMLNFTASM